MPGSWEREVQENDRNPHRRVQKMLCLAGPVIILSKKAWEVGLKLSRILVCMVAKQDKDKKESIAMLYGPLQGHDLPCSSGMLFSRLVTAPCGGDHSEVE